MLVSIIVPVYNTEKYLKKCIESITAQTYQDIEILLVNDGSTDNSLQICMDYAAIDNRIIVLSKENGGQGSARNMGIDIAKGEYIMFVDSDDWVDIRIVELLMESVKKNLSDIAVCNISKTVFEREDIACILEEKFSDEVLEGEYKKGIFDISVYSIAKLINRELFMQYNIRYPNHFFEDVSMMPVLFAYAKRISFINDSLYVYRNQGDSTVNNVKHMIDRVKCLQTFIDLFKECGMYDLYEEDIKIFLYNRCCINFKMIKKMFNRKLKEFTEIQKEFMNSIGCSGVSIPRVVVFGSYNLMTIAKMLMGLEDDATVEEYYGGESIVSVMCEKNTYINSLRVNHKNTFRRKCITNDFSKRFNRLNAGEFEDIDYVMIDFLEERYSVGVCEEERFTLSDAFLDIADIIDKEYDIIQFGSEQWKTIWAQNCDKFIDLLDKYIGKKKVILVKTKLAKNYCKQDDIIEYGNIQEIETVNDCLEWCYSYFIERCPQTTVIEVEDLKKYYTSYNFKYGCYPWHLNKSAYRMIKNEIMMKLSYTQ